jgi:hypothetical protein
MTKVLRVPADQVLVLLSVYGVGVMGGVSEMYIIGTSDMLHLTGDVARTIGRKTCTLCLTAQGYYRACVYVNRSLWRNPLLLHQISKNIEKISHQPRRNFFTAPIREKFLMIMVGIRKDFL